MQSRRWLVILTLCAAATITLAVPEAARVNPHRGYALSAAADDVLTSDDASVNVDFYGNEVSAAVARYKVDPNGVVYEEHSPQTEGPRLGSPRS